MVRGESIQFAKVLLANLEKVIHDNPKHSKKAHLKKTKKEIRDLLRRQKVDVKG